MQLNHKIANFEQLSKRLTHVDDRIVFLISYPCSARSIRKTRVFGEALPRHGPYRGFNKGCSMSTTAFDKSALDARVDQLIEEMAAHRVDIPQGEEIRRYLAGHAEGLSLLVPIVARARQEFPVPAQLSLELYHDPETAEQDLKLYVRQASYEQGFWRRLLKICEPFEETFAGMSAGWLHVTTDYRSPNRLRA